MGSRVVAINPTLTIKALKQGIFYATAFHASTPSCNPKEGYSFCSCISDQALMRSIIKEIENEIGD